MESDYDDTTSDSVIPTLDLTQNWGHDPQYQMMDERGRYIGQIPEEDYAEEQLTEEPPGGEYEEPVDSVAVGQPIETEPARYSDSEIRDYPGSDGVSYIQEEGDPAETEQVISIQHEPKQAPQPPPRLQYKPISSHEPKTSEIQKPTDPSNQQGRWRHCPLHG
jgi:hypothetical protein